MTDILERLRGTSGGVAKAGRSRAEVRKNAAVRGNRRPALLAEGDASTPAAAMELMGQLEAEMQAAAAELRFEEAALLRDEPIAERRERRLELGRASCHGSRRGGRRREMRRGGWRCATRAPALRDESPSCAGVLTARPAATRSRTSAQRRRYPRHDGRPTGDSRRREHNLRTSRSSCPATG